MRLKLFLLRGTRQSARLALVLLWLVGMRAAVAALPAEVVTALNRAQVPVQNVSMLVVPLALPDAAGQVVEQTPRLTWQAAQPRNPASVMKVVTTYAGLELLGPGYFWKTRVYAQGEVIDRTLHGNLLIQGSGDPKLVHERLADLLVAVREKGIDVIDGDILLDNAVFRLAPHDPQAFDGESLKPYNAGPDGLLVNFKSLIFKFVPQGDGVAIESEPPMAGITIPNQVAMRGGACGNWKSSLAGDFSNPDTVRFDGAYPSGCGEKEWAVAYVDPNSYAPRVIAAMWAQVGGLLSGRVKWSSAPVTGNLLVTKLSLSLGEIIDDINHFSNNVMAQQLFLTLSANGQQGSFDASAQVVRAWWGQHFAGHSAPVIVNGSGLSRTGRVTADALAALLQRAAAGPYAEAFWKSLPIASVDGTARYLAERSPNSDAIGRARFKTGTLRDAVAIAGYVSADSGRVYAVVALINDPRAQAARPALDRLVEWAVHDID